MFKLSQYLKLSLFSTLISECTDNTHCKETSKSKCDTGKNTCVGKLYEVDQRIEFHTDDYLRNTL